MHLVAAEPQRLAALILREAHVLQRRDSGLRRRAGRRVRHVHSCLRYALGESLGESRSERRSKLEKDENHVDTMEELL